MNGSSNTSPYRRRLARRITLGVISVAVLASMLRIALHMNVDFRNQAELTARNIEQHAVVQLDALRNSLWLIDDVQTQSLLDGLVESTDVKYAAVYRNGDAVYQSGSRDGVDEVVVSLNILHSHRDRTVDLGELTVVGGLAGLVTFIKQRATLMFVVSLIEIGVLIALLLFLVKRLVVDPIEQMARDAGKVAAGVHDIAFESKAFALGEPKDELGYLASSVNRMTVQLLDTQEQLERRVQSRTEMLSRTNRDLVQAQQLAGMGSWACRVDGSCSHWSKQLFRILDYPPDTEPSLALMLARVHPDDREVLSQAIVACHASRKPFECELRLLLADKRQRYARVVGEYEDIGLARGVLLDVTTEHETREELQLASVIIESTAEGVMITDAEAKIQSVNPGFTRITGYSLDEVRGNNPSVLSSGRHEGSYYQEMWQSLAESGQWHGDIWNRRKSGEIYPQWLSISAIKSNDEVVHYVGVLSDISMIQESQERLQFLAYHDVLTGLPNRLMLMGELDNAIKRARRHDQLLSVLFLDLDGFKAVNDNMGHLAGDELLRAVAERLTATVREADLLARLGGDEFVVLLEDLTGAEQVNAVALKIMNSFRQPFVIQQKPIELSVSIGISLFPQDADNTTDLMNLADAAMYLAKKEGEARYCFHGHRSQSPVDSRPDQTS